MANLIQELFQALSPGGMPGARAAMPGGAASPSAPRPNPMRFADQSLPVMPSMPAPSRAAPPIPTMRPEAGPLSPPRPASPTGQQGDLLQRLFETLSPGAGAAPSGAPGMGSAGTPMPGSGGQGINFRDIVRDIAAGAASGDPTAPPLKAFATGMAGAGNAMDTRQERARKAEIEAAERARELDDRGFERGIKTAAERRAESAERRAARKAEIENAKTATEIMRSLDPGLTTDQRFKLEGEVNDYLKAFNPFGDRTLEELSEAADQYRKDFLGRIENRTAAPAAPAPAAPEAVPSGTGTQDSPARPADRDSFDALPPGAWFINPADGRLMQKR